MSPTEPGQSPGFLLWHATLRWQRGIGAALEPLGLTHVQFVLLASTWWLNEHGEPPNQVALAGFAGTDVKMTSQVLRDLERRGLVRREVDPRDTRARRVVITSSGAALAPRAIEIVERVDEEFFSAVPQRSALSMLKKLAHGEPATR
jgi:DNA-binding MarR family transcriptional regulator